MRGLTTCLVKIMEASNSVSEFMLHICEFWLVVLLLRVHRVLRRGIRHTASRRFKIHLRGTALPMFNICWDLSSPRSLYVGDDIVSHLRC